jgi:hypothetical protein
MRGHCTRRLPLPAARLTPNRTIALARQSSARATRECTLAVMESLPNIDADRVIAITGEFATRTFSMEHLTSTPRRASRRNPYIPRSKRFRRVRVIGTTARASNAREMLSNHIFGNRRAAISARECKTAPPSEWPSGMMSMKNPERARRPNPQAACARRHGQD